LTPAWNWEIGEDEVKKTSFQLYNEKLLVFLMVSEEFPSISYYFMNVIESQCNWKEKHFAILIER